jgi:ATP-binding cassette subfamily C (CFTR/MRP) protein 4
MKQWTEVETQMTSVDRVHEYSNLQPEGGLPSETIKPPADWPAKGQIEFQKVTLRYDFCNKVVLNDLSFTIKAGEKVGVVGRTGAGKSSLIAALFRLNECEGSIVIDGLDTKHMPLLNLRSRLAIIPQEPVLFTGTVRSNLDPFGDHSDDRLWQVLRQIRLNRHVSGLPGGLEATIADGGGKFSVGQKQLLCLARAMLRGSRVLILDEATANCDPDTDQLIQRTIRSEFAHCTIITIAHRLHTVLDADRVLVLNAGQVLEFDAPGKLLQQTSSCFYSMMTASGKTPQQINQEQLNKLKSMTILIG